MRKGIGAVALMLCAGCLGFSDNLAKVVDTDGSGDHRIFRIGSVTRIMMEPVLWKLEDLKIVDFDRPVTEYFNGSLPPEFESVTLRMLHDNQSGLPLCLIDPYSLGDIATLARFAVLGDSLYADFNAREAFVERLWNRHYRQDVKKREPRQSDMGYALLWMAICDRLGKGPDELCEKYLIEPYGLKDTSFVPLPGMRNRITKPCAGSFPWPLFAGQEIADHRGEGETALFSGGMLSSASDILRVCFVIMPHLDRAKAMLETAELDCGHTVWYLSGTVPGGHAFVGFDPEGKHAVAILENATRFGAGEGLELLENLANPPKEED